jgi:hypothetical protein
MLAGVTDSAECSLCGAGLYGSVSGELMWMGESWDTESDFFRAGLDWIFVMRNSLI